MKRKNVADELVEAMREAAAIAKGETEPAAVHKFPLPLEVDVRAVRALAGQSLRGGLRLTRVLCRIGSRGGGGRIARHGPI
jgi:hypothetical protein